MGVFSHRLFCVPPSFDPDGKDKGVDDTGSLLMRWDNGSGLNVVYGEDIVRKVGDRRAK